MVFILTRREVSFVTEEMPRRYDDVFISKCVVTRTLLYHGAMVDDEREQMQQKWFPSPSGVDRVGIRIMVCKSAFGTGGDVLNVRTTLQIGGAPSLVEFVKKCASAGRDGLRAT